MRLPTCERFQTLRDLSASFAPWPEEAGPRRAGHTMVKAGLLLGSHFADVLAEPIGPAWFDDDAMCRVNVEFSANVAAMLAMMDLDGVAWKRLVACVASSQDAWERRLGPYLLDCPRAKSPRSASHGPSEYRAEANWLVWGIYRNSPIEDIHCGAYEGRDRVGKTVLRKDVDPLMRRVAGRFGNAMDFRDREEGRIADFVARGRQVEKDYGWSNEAATM